MPVTPVCRETLPWIPEQESIIGYDPAGRILVEAGPGTGKTAVACGRIAWLIEQNQVNPSDIWLISFTRAAVHELRARIASFLPSPAAAAAISIATIDSHAWAINAGFTRGATITGSFEENIRKVVDLVQSHEGVAEHLSTVRHLLVDEAQDVLGPRCELLLEIITALPATTGVTVFTDMAQSIYGFAEDDSPAALQGSLPSLIRTYLPEFKEMELNQVHRTTDPTLRTIFAEGRELLRPSGGGDGAPASEIRALLESKNHGLLGSHRDDLQALPPGLEDAFLLFRSRGAALEATGYLGVRAHRLRLSGLPVVIDDWVGRVFWDWVQTEMERPVFEDRWNERVESRPDLDVSDVWSKLVRHFGRSPHRIDIRRMTARLSGGSPPLDFSRPDFGSSGPIVSTIHSSKGREAGEVRLYCPCAIGGGVPVDNPEEARVLFVGATRARTDLKVGHGASRLHYPRLDGAHRSYSPWWYKKPMVLATVEIGRSGDIDPEGLVGKTLFADGFAARDAQAAVGRHLGPIEEMTAFSSPEHGWRYLVAANGEAFCYLSGNLNHDLFEIARLMDEKLHRRRMNPPREIKHLLNYGVRTLVLSPEDLARTRLHEPWCHSGFMLAPLVSGYAFCYFR